MSSSSIVVANLESTAHDDSLLSVVASQMIQSAVHFCSNRIWSGSEGEVAEALRKGDLRSHDCFRYQLSRQISEHLSGLDDNLLEVYSYSYGDAEEEGEDRGSGPTRQLELILRVRRKTAALEAAVAALDQALLEEYRRLIAPAGDRMTSFLDVQMVGDDDMAQGTGLAVVLRSVFVPPSQVWSITR